MQQRFENLIHHPEMIVSGELCLHVNEIFVERIQAPGQ